MTPSEKYVSELCKKSFLPFWSFPNPIGKKGKELCDVFVVCDNTIIIISVKDISVSEHTDERIQYDRWVKKAVLDSTDQIYGAERFLKTVNEVYSKDKKSKIKLPKKGVRVIHRIAVAFGSKDNFPIPTGNFGKGIVHVFDEKSTFTIINELDTITDFTNYLIAKEKFVKDKSILIPTESDFLAFYLQTGFELDYPADAIASQSGLWKNYSLSDEYKEWKKDIGISFIWDSMINQLHNFHISDNTTDEKRNELEEAIRVINLEPRINRIELGGILKNAIERKVSARMLKPLPNSNHSYVFIPLTEKNWEAKESELKLRCIVARLENPNTEKIIGIAIGNNSKGESVFDICSFIIPEMNDDFIKHAKEIKNELGYFKKPVISHSKEFRK